MIFVSSSCFRTDNINDSVEALANSGFSKIELSGGTKYYDSFHSDLIKLKEKFGLTYLIHNYFPPPKKDFVLNLASLDAEISEMSLNHVIEAIKLSESLGSLRYSFHAGFLIDFKTSEIGSSINNDIFSDMELAKTEFEKNFNKIRLSNSTFQLYIENNVISSTNFNNFNGNNPFFLTDSKDLDYVLSLGSKPLLDIAHLKISCNTLNLDFEDELNKFFESTDYIHLSDNDNRSDTNLGFRKNTQLYKQLKKLDFKGKTVTLEVYEDLEILRQSFDNMQELING